MVEGGSGCRAVDLSERNRHLYQAFSCFLPPVAWDKLQANGDLVLEDQYGRWMDDDNSVCSFYI